MLWSPVQTSRMENLACQQQIQRATVDCRSLICTRWLQTILAINLRGEKSHITKGTLRINSMFHCRAQTITKIASAIVAPFFGTVFLILACNLRETESLGQFKRLLKGVRHDIRRKQLFLLSWYYVFLKLTNLFYRG